MLRDQDVTASDISTPAKTRTQDNYHEAIEKFDEEDWTYIPMPEDGKYYNIKNDDDPQDLVEDQLISPNLHILDVMEKLLDYPFLLVEHESSYEIINLSNLNKREVKDFLYPPLSELANSLSQQIEDYYEDSEDLFGPVREHTLGTWVKAKQDDVELHIAEFLTLGSMISIIKGHDPLMDKCGFKNNDEVDELGGVKELRDRVMHGNRTLVNNKRMLKKHLDRIERAEEIVQRLPDPESK
jgi:hypothetical protein